MYSHKSQSNNFARTLGSHPAYRIFVELDHAAQRREETVFITFDGCCPGLMAEDHCLWHGAVNESKGNGRVAGVIQCSLAFDKDPIVGIGEIKDHLLYHSSHKIADDAIYWQASS